MTLTPCTLTDYEHVRSDVYEVAEQLHLRSIGYDRWNATQLVGDGLEMVPVGQCHYAICSPAKLLEGHPARAAR